ncbi:flagellar export protein FliJ [Pararhodospirillum oryzae]|uniref:Flagellar export protein FliJ n=1 Tax=Pararhodospirillum oryzae TaxID=478448 RepID=A0A512H421_9PROT|nr:flagellar FliJ family protein [Pararhodospirillum oryzae]GEO80212.1 flagellar export protein FliJ [Pararhodospirillum oryzae]
MAGDLRPLIRLRRFEVDECRRALGELLKAEAALDAEAQALEDAHQRETTFAREHPEMGFTLGAYLAHHRARVAALAQRRQALEARIQEARDILAEAYRTLKTLEVSQENREKRERAERDSKEQKVLDDIGQERYRRHHARPTILE